MIQILRKDDILLITGESRNENTDSAYKRISTIPGVSKNFRFGFLRKSSIRREYRQRKYNT